MNDQTALPEYDDQGIVVDCESGWRRFCAEVLLRTHFHIKQLAGRARRKCRKYPASKKQREFLRREVAAYCWAIKGSGGDFCFDSVCGDLGLCPRQIRARLLLLCQSAPDINLLVDWAHAQEERWHGNRSSEDQANRRVGTGVAAAVRDFRRQNGAVEGRRGRETHAVCRYQNGYASG